MRPRPLHLRWTPLSIQDILSCAARPEANLDVVERMRDTLATWGGTKYGSGQRCRGVLADCIGAVFGLIDDLDGRPRAQAPSMPPDVALHDPERSAEALQALRALYAPVEVVKGREVQPFDILVVGPSLAGPSHAMLVGPQPNTIWHCSPSSGLNWTGWALGAGYETFRGAFRIGDRWRWLR